jgi:atlastin
MENPLTNKNDWIGADNEPLVGFSWKSGSTRHTSGVIAWSDVFLHDTKTEKLAIVLMDTQGLFDAQTSNADNSRIFALGTLLSSTQIFNLNGVIQEDQLAYLQAATQFGKFTLEEFVVDTEAYTKPFQNLMFLMRDWEYQDDYNYGLAGGAQYIKVILDDKPDQSPTLRGVRKYIKNSFDQVNCFLMPHPGFKVVSDSKYDGRWSELDETFKNNLEHIIETLLMPKNLNKKRIMGKEVTGKTYAEYAAIYFKTFQSPNLIDPEVTYAVTLEKQLEGLTEQSFDFYKAAVKDFEDISRPNFEETLKKGHSQAKQTALLMYRSFRKLGSTVYDLMYEKELEREIELHHNLTSEVLMDTYNKVSQQTDEREIAMLKMFQVNLLKTVYAKVQHDRERQMILIQQETDAKREQLRQESEKRENDSLK